MARAILAALILAATTASYALAAEEKAMGEKSDKPAGATDAKADPYVVPNDAAPKELVAFITKLISGTPPRDIETVRKLRAAILEAAEKILNGKPNDDEREFAVQAKMNMLEKPEQLTAFVDELQKGGHEKLARQVRSFLLQTELRKQLMGEGKDVHASVETAVKFLEETPPQLSDMSLAYTAGMLTEMSGDNKLANKTYERLAKVFAASKDVKLAEFSKVLEGVVRRLNLIGQEMKLDGKLLDGTSLDWSKYAGKVVLVSFWSTDYPSCIRDLPNMKACYDAYHKKGFDIVAISLDRKPADVADCIKARGIAWANVIGGDKPNPAMIYYGITNLPTTMLVGKDGKVMAMNVRGEGLKKTLEKLFGPTAEKKAK